MLSFLFFLKAIEEDKQIFSLLSGLIIFLGGAYDLRIAYIGIFIFFFYFLFYSVLKWSLRSAINNFFHLMTIFTVFIALNLYWILNFLETHSLSNNPILSRILFGNEFLNILYSITLYHPFWTGKFTSYFHPQPIALYFWLIPIFAFFGFYLNRKNIYILFFGLLALIGIFLTKQVGNPFPNVYPWLFGHFPGFNAFREASKFYFLISLSYAVLVGGFIAYIFQNGELSKNVKWVKYPLAALIATIFLWNLKPVLTGELGGIYVSREVPSSYNNLNNIFFRDDSYFRSIWVPYFSSWFINSNKHPVIGLQGIIESDWKKFNLSKNDSYEAAGEEMVQFLKTKFVHNLLSVSAIRYVIVPFDDTQEDINLFQYYGKSREYYVNELDKIKFLRKINIKTNEIAVYENENYRPHLYITQERESIVKNLPFKEINYKFVNPTKYTFSVKNVLAPFYLNFSESYHSQWDIRIGNFSWWDVLTTKDYFISNKDHIKNDAGLNSYLIDPKLICRQFICKKNMNGSYDISGTLYFAPQSYMYLGLIISGATLISILGYLGFGGLNYLKNKYGKKNN